jgi:peptide/nickel transport system substrate-binding protein
MDPRNLLDKASFTVARQIFETPFFPPLDAAQEATPKLFEASLQIDVSGRGKTFQGKLRQDLAFSDGVPFEPRHLLDAMRDNVDLVGGVKLEFDGHHATFELDEPNPKFELQICSHPLVFRTVGDAFVGTGPYRLGHASETELVLLRNEHHPRPAPIAEIAFRAYPPDDRGRPRALLAALESGEVDLAPNLSWRDVSALQQTAKVLRPVNSTGSLYFNTERLTSRTLRRAIAYAINRLELSQLAFGDNALAFQATGLLPPALGRQMDGVAHSPTIAKRLLDEAGRPAAPLKLAAMFAPRPYLPDPVAVGEAIRRQLERLGVEVQVTQPADADEYRTLIVGGDYDLFLGGNIADSPDPANFLRDVLGSTRIPDRDQLVARFNFARFREPALDRALDEYRASRRTENLQRVTQLLAEEMPLFPLLYGRASAAHSWRLKGFQPSVTSTWDMSQLSLR